ncbi:hypothetical protein [Parablautia muri]|uniref:Uncharacterized protein n=1 Tax=Parablautia muri TaxID=2320879 RepID=A0A9X5BJ42_9FIRM|nr:hypothetical protein [Parablautia muri]NBJ94634.1 hypothetical protein [Parablautia muri]
MDFFGSGSALIDESECYRLRYSEAVAGTMIGPDDFEKKVIEFSKQNLKGDHEEKNNPKAEQIQTDNGYRMRWECEVDRAIASGVAEAAIQQIKKSTSLTVSKNPLIYSAVSPNGLEQSS